ncbi:hypothetical protein PM082_009980 [Marasmius tenuissimus]|nr:hypothetical protein PM082_009980 [Marasmius tenuissimus]
MAYDMNNFIGLDISSTPESGPEEKEDQAPARGVLQDSSEATQARYKVYGRDSDLSTVDAVHQRYPPPPSPNPGDAGLLATTPSNTTSSTS